MRAIKSALLCIVDTLAITEEISDRQGVPDKSVKRCFNCKTLFYAYNILFIKNKVAD